jgi:DNA-binding PadR family transcriptional regulator
MTSQVNWAVLGLLIERPDYKYRLAQRFESSYGDVLSFGSPSHINAAVEALMRRGLIEKMPRRRDRSGPERREPGPHYRATPEGRQGYRQWMLAQASEVRRQSRLFSRQLAVLAGEPDVALEILEHRQKACLEDVTRAQGAVAEGTLPGSSAPGLADRLVAEDDRTAVHSALTWSNYARSEFKALKEAREK